MVGELILMGVFFKKNVVEGGQLPLWETLIHVHSLSLSEYFRSFWLEIIWNICLPFCIFQGEQCNVSTAHTSLPEQVIGRSIKRLNQHYPDHYFSKLKL